MVKHAYPFLASALLAALTFNTYAAPNIQLNASRLTGVAPLAVHFDATGTTDTSVSDPFRQLRYNFNFGDPASGSWQHSRLSKNIQSGGPLAAHVYDNPGTYTTILNVGNVTEQITIDVQDPNSFFSGTNTICLSRNTSMAGCPSGAQQITNITSWPIINNNKRYMLRVGQDFRALGNLVTQQIHNVQFTSFGSGAKPILASLFIQQVRSDYTGPWLSNVEIIGLSASEISHGITGSNLLVYKNTISGPNGLFFAHGFSTQRNIGTYRSSLTLPMNMFAVENISTIRGGRHTGEGQTIWMGNLFDNTNEHNLRLWQSYKSIISHNNLPGHSTLSGKENIKVHSAGTDMVIPTATVSTTSRYRSSYIVISNNTLNSSTSRNIWNTIGVKPQDRNLVEGIENVIMENNTHIKGLQDTTPGAFAGRNIITRSEIFVGGTRSSPSINHLGGSLPLEWQGPYFIGAAITIPAPIPPDDRPKVPLPPIMYILQE